MVTYKASELKRKEQVGQSFKYDEVFQGYVLTPNEKLIAVAIGTEEDLFRFEANERKHIFPEFDPEKHSISYNSYHLDFKSGIPFKIYERAKDTFKIPDGLYTVHFDHEVGPYLKELSIYTDKYVNYRENANQEIYNDLIGFKNDKEKYINERGRHRTSILLYGPPGNGKTREICRILESSKENGFVSIFVPGSFPYLDRIDALKKPLEGRDVVFVLEEITERTKDSCNVEELLSLLDGEMSWNNCFTIATTNYPDALPSNIVDRPGRFSKVIEFKNPTKKEIETFLLSKNYKLEHAEKYSALLNGLSLDYICFIITESKIKGKSIETILTETKSLRDKISHAFKRTMSLSGD